MATVRYFAAAADAAGRPEQQVEASTLGDLLAAIQSDKDERFATVLSRCSVLVNGTRVSNPATALPEDATVDVLPPFAGG